MTRFGNSTLPVTLILLIVTAARGQELPVKQPVTFSYKPVLIHVPGQPEEKKWKLVLAPYVWAAGMKGTTTSNGSTSNVDMSFGDIFSYMKYGAIGHGELFRSRVFLLSDTVMLSVEGKGSASGKILGPLGGSLKGNLEATVASFSLIQELLVGYRVYERQLNRNSTRYITFDLLAGGRYYNMEGSVDVDVSVKITPPQGPPVKREVRASVTSEDRWIDPVVGGRFRYDPTDEITLSLRGDVGGVGVGSKLAWSTTALGEWRFRDDMSLVGGYKILDINYDNGDSAYDLRMHGPIGTVALKWEF